MKPLIVVMLVVGLAGCNTAAELAKLDDGKCQSYGAAPGSPPYIQCRAQLEAARTQAKANVSVSY
jgi:uncharacterized lipoprotein